MAARVWPVDAVTGAPSYSGRALRQTSVSTLVGGATTARPLGGRSGVRPGTATTIATATSTVWTVTPFGGLLDGATAAEAGVYEYSFDTNQTGSVTAAGASARTDRLDVQVVDPAEGGVAGANPLIRIVYTVGTPGLAAAPAQSHALARINVPISGGGSPTVTWVAPYAVAAGGIVPAADSTAYPADTIGQPIWDIALKQFMISDGTAKVPIGGNVPGGRIVRTGTSGTFSSATWTVLNTGSLWTTDQPVTGGMTVTNGVFTVPIDGMYDIEGGVLLSTATAAALIVKKNSTAASAVNAVVAQSGSHSLAFTGVNVNARVRCTAGDTLVMAIFPAATSQWANTPDLAMSFFGVRYAEPLR